MNNKLIYKFNKFNILKLIVIAILIVVLFIIFSNVVYFDAELNELEEKEDPYAYLLNQNNDGNIKYTEFLNNFSDYIIDDYYKCFNYDSYKDLESNEELFIALDNHGYSDKAIMLKSGMNYNFNVTVEKNGLYNLYFDYYLLDETIIDTTCEVKINSDIQYYEMRQLQFNGEWVSESTYKTDRYGNEIIPSSKRLDTWYIERNLFDGSSLHPGCMYVALVSGSNTINIDIKSGGVIIGNIYVESKEELPSYKDYLESYKDKSKYNGDLIKIGAENIYSKSSLDIRIYSLQDASASRYETKHKLLNAVYEQSFDNGNHSITYKLDIEEEGMYCISIKYLQDAFLSMPTNRTIMINGKVPFAELNNYNFYFTKKWKNETLHNDDGSFYIYLDKGINYLTLSVNMDLYRYVVEEIDRIMDEMSEMALEIKYLTNGQADTYRNWNISTYIPNLEDELNRWASEIDGIRDYLKSYSNDNSYSSTFSNLALAVKKLKKLAKDPDQIPNNMTSFTDGSSSVSQLLGNLILTFNSNPLGLEQIYLGCENAKLPKPTSNIFVKFFEGFKRFIYSFFKKEYGINKAKNDEIEVWVNRSRQYVEIMQQMADDAGLKVTFSIMPDENKLILANTSKTLPDVAMGVSNWIPYNLALRGIIQDLRCFDGYSDLVSNFAKGALIPYAYEDGMYGLPETQDFWITFYRTDIYESLNLDCPSDWDALLGQLPILQRLGYNFYSPLSSYRGLKPYVATLPFFYQWGASSAFSNTFTGSLYSEDGMSTTLSDESFVSALKFMTDMFTIYDVPEETLSFYNSFRYGTLPIGIANCGTYTQLLIAAPEINGNWDIAPHIGFSYEGNTYRYSTAGSNGITMFSSSKKKDQAWQFIKWWMSKDTQENYIERLYGMYGLEYLWYSANMEAFKTLPIDSKHKDIMIEQLINWSMDASRIPASYMLERSISDAYSKVVYNGVNVRIALDDAVIESNREIRRKMTEFNYMKDDVKIKDYIVPNIYNIGDWTKEH